MKKLNWPLWQESGLNKTSPKHILSDSILSWFLKWRSQGNGNEIVEMKLREEMGNRWVWGQGGSGGCLLGEELLLHVVNKYSQVTD